MCFQYFLQQLWATFHNLGKWEATAVLTSAVLQFPMSANGISENFKTSWEESSFVCSCQSVPFPMADIKIEAHLTGAFGPSGRLLLSSSSAPCCLCTCLTRLNTDGLLGQKTRFVIFVLWKMWLIYWPFSPKWKNVFYSQRTRRYEVWNQIKNGDLLSAFVTVVTLATDSSSSGPAEEELVLRKYLHGQDLARIMLSRLTLQTEAFRASLFNWGHQLHSQTQPTVPLFCQLVSTFFQTIIAFGCHGHISTDVPGDVWLVIKCLWINKKKTKQPSLKIVYNAILKIALSVCLSLERTNGSAVSEHRLQLVD